MSPIAYRAILAALGLTGAGLARLLRLDPHTPSRWACGQARVPHSVALLLLAAREGYVTVEDMQTLDRRSDAE